MTKPASPEGYTSYQRYTFPRWLRVSVMLFLLAIGGIIIFLENVILFPERIAEFIIGVGIAIMAGLYIHESLHYISGLYLGYDPTFLWPNGVYMSEHESLQIRESVFMLLAPQLLSIASAGVLFANLTPNYELIIGWMLVLNLGGGANDVLWVFRRIVWPPDTKVVVGEDHENYVAFPENTS